MCKRRKVRVQVYTPVSDGNPQLNSGRGHAPFAAAKEKHPRKKRVGQGLHRYSAATLYEAVIQEPPVRGLATRGASDQVTPRSRQEQPGPRPEGHRSAPSAEAEGDTPLGFACRGIRPIVLAAARSKLFACILYVRDGVAAAPRCLGSLHLSIAEPALRLLTPHPRTYKSPLPPAKSRRAKWGRMGAPCGRDGRRRPLSSGEAAAASLTRCRTGSCCRAPAPPGPWPPARRGPGTPATRSRATSRACRPV